MNQWEKEKLLKKLVAKIINFIFPEEPRKLAEWYRDEIIQALDNKDYERVAWLIREEHRCCGRFCSF